MQSSNRAEADLLLEISSSVVAAYVSNNAVPHAELPSLIHSVFVAFGQITHPAINDQSLEPLKPIIPIKKTVAADHLVSLEDGKRYRTLTRHLARFGLTPDAYRAKWGLPPDYPMACAEYSESRSELAKRSGLGTR